MPTICDNVLTVRGEAEALAGFLEFARGGQGAQANRGEERVFSFERFVPVPDGLADSVRQYLGQTEEQRLHEKKVAELIATYGYRDRYDFCCDYWGTKWDAMQTSVDAAPDGLTYYFLTAWSPPTPVVLAASEQFPTLSFELSYGEPSVGFAGEFECQDGVVTKDLCEDWDAFGDGDDDDLAVADA